ncbi:MAG: pantoate--beta-alanine ligase, partial [Bacteroidales bacterium]
FNGVAQVVSILFDIIKPDIAYFGQKDFQQLAIIKKLIIQKEYKIKITTCPIIRESDGLAMSSRNILLEPAHRKNAGIIYRTISEAAAMIHSSEISDIKKHVSNSINSIPGFRVEYFEIVDETELIPVNEKKLMKQGRKYYGCIAVWAGNVRLIDNTEFHFPVSKG